MLSSLLVLENPIQNYAWGSRTAIAELLGRPLPSSRPEAELWIGAHPKAPSRVIDPPGLGSLDRVIEDQPQAVLGAETCSRFGNELPFLLKVLAAAEPLSIQAHPSQEQARRGWARENAEGIPLDAPRRNYRDPNHKPELVCALSAFTALLGFRDTETIARSLEPLARPEMGEEIDRAGREGAPALRALFARLLTLEAEESRPVLARAARAVPLHADPAWSWVGRLLARYPGDVGALAPLYLNLVTLEPGDALFLPAGELHAYLEGTALEIMANSDNVLRGGLTAKHVDVPELLATLSFQPKPPSLLRPVGASPGECRFLTPAREFELSLLEVLPQRPFAPTPGHGVEILLGLSGTATIRGGGRKLPVGRGRTVLVPAALPAYTLEGEGRLARARVPG
ncbi:MAG TPA: mannose-6-phosphate isomerase, class I [Vicinamibacteria bacterium]|nr:mannose-6-phosphate isomerase, class I [Vicinamibacteria bacterium]